jgi:multicomponent Na+:H+ antiporter subunit E
VLRRFAAAFCWAYLTWALLTCTLTIEQVAVGVLFAGLAALVCAPLGPLAGPWAVLVPRRALALARLAGGVFVRMVRANLSLTRLIWSRHPRPRSGMVIVGTQVGGDGSLATVGMLTSVVVDSQLVDVDRARGRLQYHVVEVAGRARINGPVEDLLRAGISR